jgi:hypothetical protein
MATPQSPTARRSTSQPPKTNGADHDPGLDLRELLRALQAVRDGVGFDSHCIKPLDVQRLFTLLDSLPAPGSPGVEPAARMGE